MPTMNVNLTPEFAEFVSSEIASGEYASASELVHDALRLLRRERDIEVEKLELLRRKLDVGLEQSQRRVFSARSVADIDASVLAEEARD